MKIELPIATDLPITSHPDVALPMSIIMTIPNIENWLCSEFIQLYSNNIFIKYYNYGSCETYEPLETIRMLCHLELGKDIIDFFRNFIKNCYYSLVFCDDSQIKTMNIQRPRLHGILLFGFDDTKQEFDAYGYNGYKLAKFKVSYEDLINAYYSDFCSDFKDKSRSFDGLTENDEIHTVDSENNLIVLYRIKAQEYTSINIEKFKWHLLDYMESVDTIGRERPNLALLINENLLWGMDTYSVIQQFYRYCKENQRFIGYADAYCLYEHKKNMLQKIRYLDSHTDIKINDDITNSFSELINEATLFINHVIKYNNMVNHSNTDNAFSGILLHLETLENKELRALNEYYEYNRFIFENI